MLNNLIKIKKKKIRVGRGIGSGRGKTSSRGHKGQKSRSGVAIKSFEGGQMPLYRRLPKRGFKSFNKRYMAIINLSDIQNFIKAKKINTSEEVNIKNLKEKKLIRKNLNILKILGNGEVKEKIKISTNYVSKSAKSKIEKAGGSINILQNKKK
jgi:large subunit ribosomal protein L15